MASLGSLGKRKPRRDLTFDYFGETIRVNPAFGDAHVQDFMEAARDVDQESAGAQVLVKDVLRSAVHVDDFDRFWQLVKDEGQDVEDQLAVFHAIVAAVAERPTSRSSDSSGGPSTTAPSSTGGSEPEALQVVRQLEAEGRPDLAVPILRQYRERRPA